MPVPRKECLWDRLYIDFTKTRLFERSFDALVQSMQPPVEVSQLKPELETPLFDKYYAGLLEDDDAEFVDHVRSLRNSPIREYLNEMSSARLSDDFLQRFILYLTIVLRWTPSVGQESG